MSSTRRTKKIYEVNRHHSHFLIIVSGSIVICVQKTRVRQLPRNKLGNGRTRERRDKEGRDDRSGTRGLQTDGIWTDSLPGPPINSLTSNAPLLQMLSEAVGNECQHL